MKNRIVNLFGRALFHKAAIPLLALLILSLAALTGEPTKNQSPRGLNFDHSLHVKEQDIGCTDCHESHSENTALMTVPGHDQCSACHGEQIEEGSETENCAMCHAGERPAKAKLEPGPIYRDIAFDHAKHSAKGVDCVSCHASAADVKILTRHELLPKMQDCVSCHKSQSVKKGGDCTTCHMNGSEHSRPADHNLFWQKTHAQFAVTRDQQESCNSCHTIAQGNDCQSCHQRQQPNSHNLAFKMRGHAIAAQNSRESCATCHTEASCASCHNSTPPVSHTAMWGAPYSRHCNGCHMGGSNFTAIVSSGSNCTTCHSLGAANAKHVSRATPLPSGHNTSGCVTCHGWGSSRPVKHPVTSENNCLQCHN